MKYSSSSRTSHCFYHYQITFQLIENPVLNKSNRITLNYIRYHTWTTNTKLFHILKPYKLSFRHWRVRLHVANDDDRACQPSTGHRPKPSVHCPVAEWGDVSLVLTKNSICPEERLTWTRGRRKTGAFCFLSLSHINTPRV